MTLNSEVPSVQPGGSENSPDLWRVSMVAGRSQPASGVVLDDFPKSQHRPSVIHVGLTIPVIRGIEKHCWNFRKALWPKFRNTTERSIPLILFDSISIDEAFKRFT